MVNWIFSLPPSNFAPVAVKSTRVWGRIIFRLKFPTKGLTSYPQVCEDISMAEQKTKITISTDDLVSVPQAAKELGVHFATLYRWIKKGIIRPFRIGGQVFLTVEDLKTLKEQREHDSRSSSLEKGVSNG